MNTYLYPSLYNKDITPMDAYIWLKRFHATGKGSLDRPFGVACTRNTYCVFIEQSGFSDYKKGNELYKQIYGSE